VDHVDAAVDACINVGPERPRKAADLCGEPEIRDGPDYIAFGIRGCGKARFDGVDSYSGELFSNTELLFKRERDTWCLFTVAQRGVENSDVFVRTAIGEEDSTLQRSCVLQRL
jgi:hypothetical protein